MRRTPQTFKLDKKLYKHFAVVTVFLTLCLAMLADGGTRNSIETHISKKQQQSDLRKAQAAKMAGANHPIKIGVRRDAVWGVWGESKSAGDSGGTINAQPPPVAAARPAAPQPQICNSRQAHSAGLVTGRGGASAPLPGSPAALRSGQRGGCVSPAAVPSGSQQTTPTTSTVPLPPASEELRHAVEAAAIARSGGSSE